MSDLQPLLVVQHLTLSFGGVVAVDDLSFAARDGEITGLVGPEGAGKTSVLDCITGLTRPPVGRIELRSRSGAPFLLERMDADRIVREARVVRAFRNPRIFSRMTALQNILVALYAARSRAAAANLIFLFTSRSASEKAGYWLDRMGLAHVADRPAGALPRGLQRRLEIARALATAPRLLCIDEPATGLDSREKDDLLRHLQELKRQPLAILITAHDFRLAESLCDHVVAMDHGAAIASGTPGGICGQAALLRAGLGVPHGGETVPRIHVSC